MLWRGRRSLPAVMWSDRWVHRCYLYDYCVARSKVRILPNLQMGGVEAREAQPIELQPFPSPPGFLAAARGGVEGEVDFLCLAPDGTSSESEQEHDDKGISATYWITYDPPTFVARETFYGEEDNYHSFAAHRACDGEPFKEVLSFHEGPAQSAFMQVDEGWKVTF